MRKILVFILALYTLVSCTNHSDTITYQYVIFENINKSIESLKKRNEYIYKRIMMTSHIVPETNKELMYNSNILKEYTYQLIHTLEDIQFYLLYKVEEDQSIKTKLGEPYIDLQLIDNPDHNTEMKDLVDEELLSKLDQRLRSYWVYIDTCYYSLNSNYFSSMGDNFIVINTSKGDKMSWGEYNLKNLPLSTVIINLQQCILQVLLIENLVLDYLWGHKDRTLTFNKMEAVTEVCNNEVVAFMHCWDSVGNISAYVGEYDTLTYKLIGEENIDWMKCDTILEGRVIFPKDKLNMIKNRNKGFIRITHYRGESFFPFEL